MRNYIQPGKFLTYAHNAAVTPGQALLMGALLGIAANAYAANEPGEYAVEGVFELPAEPAAVAGIGDKAYWDPAKARIFAEAAAGRVVVGVFAQAKAAGMPSAAVRLNGAAI
ncbi:DUF2190 family protein [Cupriavidus malaysiensis]|uniref:DUF2190 family protein n=1 Tax=Cupriavidus malaysiensis TaxID=367825 RepID=A0ABM6F3F5_9BURK|nr:DUF2190 family protein [Cupriavidus malaysiensis]AOZ05960.1 hypothetical protein BKK80_09060 [Cupriavidus malaysiensis]